MYRETVTSTSKYTQKIQPVLTQRKRHPWEDIGLRMTAVQFERHGERKRELNPKHRKQKRERGEKRVTRLRDIIPF